MTGKRIAGLVWSLAQDTLVETARGLVRFWPLSLGFAACVILMVLFVDRPLALWLWALPSADKAFFTAINEVGRSGWMFGVAAVWLVAALLLRRDDWAIRAAFVIGAIAMGGWVVNVLKLVFARARPRLLVGDEATGDYGFRGFAIDPDWNSFPSGHSQASASLAAALACIWPRFGLVFLGLALLPAVARAVNLNHFASDVATGYLAGCVVTFALARACAARSVGPITTGERR
ncbi:phosphatase PAP2 family protein [Zavarzinia aquatilis]|uniref:Phosphatidic acid phosphatase type 2/haloperoxidase domain-containing protein n=1 Tax=Zavarzinia aquatilis TaxID=2211142 RepID=A0A317DY17_9PROT|nr:phosphatase PAP2 family protein [Zavarzinia aquatilis]PWR17883.1 hypothetical protein DKG74_20400 [Zavarzinia aquatilis]